MSDSRLLGTLGSIAGDAHVRPGSERLDGRTTPRVIVEPGTAEEVVECVKACAAANAAVIPSGFGTWLEGGNPLRRADVVLSLRRMNRVIDYSPPDLTVVAEAGLGLAELNRLAAQQGQWLPLDPPGLEAASLGAVASCASSGPLRLGYGGPRDYVIGLQLVHADGARSKSGGRVAKNVAGYDMNKLYVGSFGTLAIITELAFKLRPAPEKTTTLQVTTSEAAPVIALTRLLLASHLEPVSLFVTSGLSRSEADDSDGHYSFLARFAGGSEEVAYQVRWVREVAREGGVRELAGDEESRAWSAIRDLDNEERVTLRWGLPISRVMARYEALIGSWQGAAIAVDAGVGLIRMALPCAESEAARFILEQRELARKDGGVVVIERGSAELKAEAETWAGAGATAGLMRSIKAKFDPDGLLSPGRFVDGI